MRGVVGRVLGITLIALVLAISVQISVQYQVNYAVPWAPPSERGLSELRWIRENYGYFNRSVIVVVRDISSYLWQLAYDGGLVYFGNLMYLLTNKTDTSLINSSDQAVRNAHLGSVQRLWTYGVFSSIDKSRYTVLVPSHIYGPDPIESQILTPVGGGVSRVHEAPRSFLDSLLNSWILTRSSGDWIQGASSYISLQSLVPCNQFGNWASISSAAQVSVEAGFKVSDCSLRVDLSVGQEATLYLQLRNDAPWNFSQWKYFGFYFKGSVGSGAPPSLITVLANDQTFSSYFHYSVEEASVWDGNSRSFLLPLDSFQSRGTPSYDSIESIYLGIYTSRGTSLVYYTEYFVVG